MRAYEFLEHSDPPSKPLTLRALNHLKREKNAREESDRQRQAIVSVMYTDPSSQQEQLDLERQLLELEQLKAEIAATNAETAAKSAMVLHTNAKSGIAAMDKNQQKITKLAKNGLGRQKKV